MSHRYWQIDIQTCAAGVFGALSKVEMATAAGGTNLCVSGAACAASSSQGSPHTPDGALPGTGYWGGSGAIPVQWRYDMGSAVDITEVRITSIAGLEPYHPATWNLRSSDDDITYTTVQSYTAAAWVGGVQQVFSVAPTIPTGALLFSGFAPTPTPSGIVSLTQIGVEVWEKNDPALSLTQIAAEIWCSVLDVVPPGALLFTGFAPTPSVVGPLPASGALLFTGFAPSISIASTPAVGGITFTGFAPTSTVLAPNRPMFSIIL